MSVGNGWNQEGTNYIYTWVKTQINSKMDTHEYVNSTKVDSQIQSSDDQANSSLSDLQDPDVRVNNALADLDAIINNCNVKHNILRIDE